MFLDFVLTLAIVAFYWFCCYGLYRLLCWLSLKPFGFLREFVALQNYRKSGQIDQNSSEND